MTNNERIPSHVAIILDGNGRWAKQRGKTRSEGHKAGFDKVKDIASYASKRGIKALSLYCFSTENWNRPNQEVDFLMSIPIKFKEESKIYKDNNIKVIVSGRKYRINKNTLDALNDLVDDTKESTGMILNICFDYGSLNDLMNTINNLIENGTKLDEEKAIYSHLSTNPVGPVDLLIRTGGEKRLSNFLLLEAAYAELYFIDKYWPDFNSEDLDKAILEYSKRDRRYGGIKDE